MNITTGKHVRINTGNFIFERTAETPGIITVRCMEKSSYSEAEVMHLPAQSDYAERFIAAYRRIIEEDVEYRKAEWESMKKEV